MTAISSGESLYKINAFVIQTKIQVTSPKKTIEPLHPTALTASDNQTTLNMWHKRLVHINGRAVQRMASGVGVTGMTLTSENNELDDYCHGFLLGKMHKLHFQKSTNKTTAIGECIVSDLA